MSSTGDRTWRIIEGILLVVVGVLALGAPVFAGLATALTLGWVVIAAGVIRLVAAFQAHTATHRGWKIAAGVLAILIGILLLAAPLAGAFTLTSLMAAFLIITAVTSFAAWNRMRASGRHGAGWALVTAIVDLVLGIYVLTLGPVASLVTVGYVVAFAILFAGISLLLSRAPASAAATPV